MTLESAVRTVDVLVVGGGPAGLMLSIELGRRGVSVLLVDEKAATAVNPQANATQAAASGALSGIPAFNTRMPRRLR